MQCETVEEYPATDMQQSSSVQHGVPVLRSGDISLEAMFQRVYLLILKYLPYGESRSRRQVTVSLVPTESYLKLAASVRQPSTVRYRLET